jgi:uncharacterized integral membrane protein
VIATVPYLLSLVLYIRTYRDMFVPLQREEPSGWLWKANQVIITSSVTPLVLLARPGIPSNYVQWLIGVALLSVLLYVIVMASMVRASYFRTQLPLATGRWEMPSLTPARVMLIVGCLVIAGCAAVTVWVGLSINP